MLLILIACNGTLFIEGRPLKSKGTNERYSKEDQKETGRHGSQVINSLQNPEGNGHGYDLPVPYASDVTQNLGFEETVEAYNKDDFRPTTPGSSPGVGHYAQTLGFDESVAGYKDDFRPTTPGSSPGVGHSFATKEDDVQSDTKIKGTSVSHSMEGNENDFRPTGPGHSPGVGHAFPSTNVKRSP